MFRRVLLREWQSDRRALRKWAFEDGWRFLHLQQEDCEQRQAYEIAWLSGSGKTSLHYMEDFLTDSSYFVVTGPDVASLAVELFDWFSGMSAQWILQRPHPDPAIRAHQVRQLGLLSGWPAAREAVKTQIEVASRDEAEAIRVSSVVAMAYDSEQSWAVRLAEIAVSDPSEVVRREAEMYSNGILRPLWHTSIDK